MQQERNVVILDDQIALVDFGGERKLVEIRRLQLRTRRIQMNAAVLAITCACNLRERLALGKFDDGVIELAGHDEIDLRRVQQAVRLDLDMRADKSHLDIGLYSFDRTRQRYIVRETYRRCEQDQEVVVPRDLDRLLRRDAVRRRIQQTAARQHSSRISQPDGIPV